MSNIDKVNLIYQVYEKYIQILLYPGDSVNCMGDWEIRSVSRRTPDKLALLALY